jgi:hypothetical protein
LARPWQQPAPPYPAGHGGEPYGTGSLGIVALVVAAVCCGPIGVILGVIALATRREQSQASIVCAWTAIGIGAVSSLFLPAAVIVNSITSS